MSARPLDRTLAEFAERPAFLCTDRADGTDGPEPYVHLTASERDALIRYCRTARAALVGIGRDLDAHDAEYAWGVARGACERALRDLDAIAGDGA